MRSLDSDAGVVVSNFPNATHYVVKVILSIRLTTITMTTMGECNATESHPRRCASETVPTFTNYLCAL
jgi:hypothetical protein